MTWSCKRTKLYTSLKLIMKLPVGRETRWRALLEDGGLATCWRALLEDGGQGKTLEGAI